MAKGGPGGGVEGSAAVEDHRNGERELQPDRAVGHPEEHHDGAQDDSHQQPRAVGNCLRGWSEGGLGRNAKSQVLDGGDEIPYVRSRGVELDGGGIRGQIDHGPLDPRSAGEGPLDGAGAGGASHAGDG